MNECYLYFVPIYSSNDLYKLVNGVVIEVVPSSNPETDSCSELEDSEEGCHLEEFERVDVQRCMFMS